MNSRATPRTISVYVVADFEPLRLGLEEAIQADRDLKLTGSASTLAEMVTSGGFRDANVLVVDSDALNRANITEVKRSLAEWFPELTVLFVGDREDGRTIVPEDIPTYMSMSTVGFLYKSGDSERLCHAIKLLATGGFVCEASVIRHILTRLTQWAAYTNPAEQAGGGNLSDRETAVLNLVAHGRSNREIAQELFVSEGTVKAHISHIMSKLGLERRTEIVRYAITTGLVQLTDELT